MENWIEFTENAQFDEIVEKSKAGPVVIFKHSTRCSISAMAWSRFNRGLGELLSKTISFYYLDIIAYRGISNMVADKFGIRHESPQILVILNGNCVHDSSHMAIGVKQVAELAEKN